MRRTPRLLTLSLALALSGHAASAADNWVVKDAGGAFVTLRSKDTGSGQAQFHIMADSNGAAYSSTNPVFVQLNAGSANIGSVNVAALPSLPAGTNNVGSIANITGTVSLPTGAATAALQTTGNTALATLNATLTSRLPLDTNNVLKTVLYDSTGAAVTYGGTTAVQGVVGGVAVPVSMASQPLPAGAATAAKQPALGTAGTASADVLSMQGVAGGVAVPVTGAVSAAGSVGTDASANAPALPNVGAAFGGSGPYAGYVLIRSIPAAASRLNVEVQNTSGGPIVIVRDDGVAASGAAPANATLIPLSGGQSAGQQGGTWSSATFRGRLQIYAPTAGVFVSAALD